MRIDPAPNPQAFPGTRISHETGRRTELPMPGMSLRDYFAAKAMQSIELAYWQSDRACNQISERARASGRTDSQQIALLARATADAMLAERSKGDTQ